MPVKKVLSGFLLFISTLPSVFGQSLPVKTPVLEEYYRRKQLLGQLDSALSFTIRPTVLQSKDSLFRLGADSLMDLGQWIGGSVRAETGVRILPVIWQQQYHGEPTYSRNNGSLIPAKGYQTRISAGMYAKYKFLSVQLQPEFVFAENADFKQARLFYGGADLPSRFGDGRYAQASWGQSSVRLTFDPVSIGLSSENIWWGPGIRNSLLMSNTAAGFKHITLNTVRPVRTPIGSIEGQIIAGRLEGSGYTAGLPDDWRYLSGIALSYQPKWVPGLFLGLTRSFQMYHKDMNGSFEDYVPFLQAFAKKNTNEDDKPRDQLASFFGRYLFAAARAEVYFEYGFNDHSNDIRDFLMAPDHSRAYTIGFTKLIPYKGEADEYIQIGIEGTQMSQSIDRVVRDAGEWYTHSQVLHGYTNLGDVLGAGVGPGGNVQNLNISWVKDLKRIGVEFERYVHNADLANTFGYSQWVDVSIAAVGDWSYKNFLLNGKVQGIRAANYQWQDGLAGRPKVNAFNINAELGIMYRF